LDYSKQKTPHFEKQKQEGKPQITTSLQILPGFIEWKEPRNPRTQKSLAIMSFKQAVQNLNHQEKRQEKTEEGKVIH
jgi:hypothetical protein